MCSGGAPQRRLGDVEREPGRGREAIEQPREVPAGAGPEVDDGAGAVEDVLEQVPERRGERLEVAGLQEALARADHVRAVALGGRTPTRQQAQVALPRDVERVPGGAAHRPAVARERLPASGAPQQREHVV
jgi:hypothetical protein